MLLSCSQRFGRYLTVLTHGLTLLCPAGGQHGGGGRRGGGGGGRQPFGRSPGGPRDQLPSDVTQLPVAPQQYRHTQGITCMAFDDASKQLYTGSKDGHVKAWTGAGPDAPAPQDLDVGGEVGAAAQVFYDQNSVS